MEMSITIVPVAEDISSIDKVSVSANGQGVSFLSAILSILIPPQIMTQDMNLTLPDEKDITGINEPLSPELNDNKNTLGILPYSALTPRQSGKKDHLSATMYDSLIEDPLSLNGLVGILQNREKGLTFPEGVTPTIKTEKDDQTNLLVQFKHIEKDKFNIPEFCDAKIEITPIKENRPQENVFVSQEQWNIQTADDKPNIKPEANTKHTTIKPDEGTYKDGIKGTNIADNKEVDSFDSFKDVLEEGLKIEKTEGRSNKDRFSNLETDSKWDDIPTIQRPTNPVSSTISTDNNAEVHDRRTLDLPSVRSSTLQVPYGSDSSAIRVTVEPEGIGELDIKLILNKGVINGYIKTPETATADLIIRNIPDIINSLIRDGLNIGNLSVSLRDYDRGNGMAHEDRDRPDDRSGPNELTVRSYSSGYIDIFI